MRNIVNILLCFLLSYSIGNAQSIKRSVICSFGSSNSNSTTNISTTLGQPSNIGSVTDGLSYIRQGFQQPLGCVGGPISVTTNPTICDGDSVVVGSSVYFLSGLYSDTLVTLAGCDSIIITDLSVNQQANTGTANPLSFCLDVFSSSQVFDLNDLLLNEDPTGAWQDSTGNTINHDILPSDYGLGVHEFTYVVSGLAPCPTSSITVSLTLNDSPTIDLIESLDPSCNGLSDGSITINASGFGNLTYSWSNGETTSSISSLDADTYTLTVTDDNSCTSDEDFILENPEVLVGSSTQNNSTCFEANNGSIDLTVEGGTLPYTYLWSNSLSSEDISDLSPGNYTVDVTDSKSCNFSLNFTIDEPLVIELNPFVEDASCEEKPDGLIDLDPYGGTPPYTYLWNDGNINEDISNLYTGEYSVILTDYNNCEASLQLMVGYNTFDNCFFIPTLFTPNGDNIHDVWEIDGTDLFDNISVKVFNRWGQLVFESTGYTQAWDGKSNGKELPTATYYYSIDLNDGREPYNGPISIKR